MCYSAEKEISHIISDVNIMSKKKSIVGAKHALSNLFGPALLNIDYRQILYLLEMVSYIRTALTPRLPPGTEKKKNIKKNNLITYIIYSLSALLGIECPTSCVTGRVAIESLLDRTTEEGSMPRR